MTTNAAVAAESYACPTKGGGRSTKRQLSQTGFHCPRCIELAHPDVASNGTVRQVLRWLLASGERWRGATA